VTGLSLRRDILDGREADTRARDRIAHNIDAQLAAAPLMRVVGARLLTRSLARSARSTESAIAVELHYRRTTLRSLIHRAGGASIHRFRDELALARLAAIVEHSRIAWPFAAEILGAPRTGTLLAMVLRRTGLPGGLWRKRATAHSQMQAFIQFLISNAEAWAALPLPAPRSCAKLTENTDAK
jgi:AraC-like DNA-binding protein